MDISKQRYRGADYLLASVDAFISEWQETAPPMSLVLRPKNSVQISKEEEEVFLAFAAQKEEFIKLYPVPFTDQLHVGFYLEDATTLQIKLTGVHSGQTLVLEPGKELPAGDQSYHANTGHLQNGLYIVKVMANNKVYTRIVAKQ